MALRIQLVLLTGRKAKDVRVLNVGQSIDIRVHVLISMGKDTDILFFELAIVPRGEMVIYLRQPKFLKLS